MHEATRAGQANGSADQRTVADLRSRTPISRAERKRLAQLRAIDLQAEIDRKRAAAAEEAEQRAQIRKQRRQAASSYRRSEWARKARERAERLRRTLILVGAIVGVNAVAVVGQVSSFTAPVAGNGFGWSLWQALCVAAVVESIAIYVGWHAHVALIEGDSVMRLRLTSYAIAAGVGALNYHHYAGPDWAPTDRAVMFGAASLLSPWLWAMHSRHVHRQQLRENGLIDPRAPKFGALRWLLHRGETWQALRWAVAEGEQSPTVAVAAIRARHAIEDSDRVAAEARRGLDQARDGLIATQRTALNLALSYEVGVVAELDEEDPAATQARANIRRFVRRFHPFGPPLAAVPDPADDAPSSETAGRPPRGLLPVNWLINPGDPWATGYLVPLRSLLGPEEEPEEDPNEDRKRPTEQDSLNACKWITNRIRSTKRVPTKAEVAVRFGFSETWAWRRLQETKKQLAGEGWAFPEASAPVPPERVLIQSVNGSGTGS
jgi:hypothetical protein